MIFSEKFPNITLVPEAREDAEILNWHSVAHSDKFLRHLS